MRRLGTRRSSRKSSLEKELLEFVDNSALEFPDNVDFLRLWQSMFGGAASLLSRGGKCFSKSTTFVFGRHG